MGCVLSPDRAKMLIDSVIRAVAAVAKGVRLFGYSAEGMTQTLGAVAQLAFADDWAGAFTSLADLKRAWAIWSLWEPLSGSVIGIKKAAKTVLTGVEWRGGKARQALNPRLYTAAGAEVPFISFDEAYKHLGFKRRADGSDEEAWCKLRKDALAAIARIRKMWRPSRAGLMIVSNGLLGGLAGYS